MESVTTRNTLPDWQTTPMIPPLSGQFSQLFQTFRYITKTHTIMIQNTTCFQQVKNLQARHTRTTPDTTPCTPDSEAGICPNGCPVHKLPTNLIGTNLTARVPYRFCGVMDTSGTLLPALVLPSAAENDKKDNPRNWIIMLLESGQVAYLDIINND